MFFGKVFLSVLMSLVTLSQGREDVPLWVRPCDGGASTRAGSISIPSHRGIPTELRLLCYKLATGRSLCNEIQNRIIRVIGEGPAVGLDIEEQLSGFPNRTRFSYAELRDIREVLTYQYEQMSRVGVFLEQVFSDSSNAYVNEKRDLKMKYREILCQMHLLLHFLGHRSTQRISRDIMPSFYRSMSSLSYRHFRNYLIMRDTRVMFSHLAEQLTVHLSRV